MGRILAIDYGLKRVGIAVTDPLRIIATPLETVLTSQIFQYLQKYIQQEEVNAFVVGMPKNLNNNATDATKPTEIFVELLKKNFPKQSVFIHDERFTSKIALNAMIAGGTTKKFRRQKENIDKVSAVIILQSFLESKQL